MGNTIQNISFDDGFREISIQNDPNRIIRWNPNDLNFVDRFLRFTQFAEGDFKERVNKIGGDIGNDAEAILEKYALGTFEALGSEFNAELDKAFGADISSAAFQGANPISPATNGHLLFDNFLNALTPIIDESIKSFDASREVYTKGAKNRAQRRAAKAQS